MKKFKPTLPIISFMLAVFAIALMIPSFSYAKWHDKSDELPDNNGFPTALAVIGGVLVVGGITYMILKKDKPEDDKGTENVDKATSDNQEKADDSLKTVVDDAVTINKISSDLLAGRENRFNMYFDIDSEKYIRQSQKMDFNDMTVKAGVSISF